MAIQKTVIQTAIGTFAAASQYYKRKIAEVRNLVLFANDEISTHLNCDTSGCDFKREYYGPLCEVVPTKENEKQIRIDPGKEEAKERK